MSLTTKILASAFALVLAMAGLNFALRHFTDPATLGGHSIDPAPVAITIGATTLAIPKNIIRAKRQRQAGVAQTVDLNFQWPDFNGYNQDSAEIFQDASKQDQVIFVSLVKQPPPNTSERRLDGIYRRFFVGKAWRGPDGLIGQALDPSSGYQAEDILYARNNDAIFITRCLQIKEAERSNVFPTCLYDFQLEENVTVNVRFHRNLLQHWREIDTKLKRSLASMRLQ